jgi:NAD(P)H dehydrogenase (quinone)
MQASPEHRMRKLVVAFHSGYGHTRKVAEAVVDGAAAVAGVEAGLIDLGAIDDAGWRRLAEADAIVFGAPTYMGGPSAQFKAFADASAKVWFTQGWKDKIAGGFTCSLTMSGDKYATLMAMVTLAMQHGMVWVGLGMLPSERAGDPDQLNRLGSYLGLMAQADNLPPDQSPPPGDLETAFAYGQRIAGFAKLR